MSDGEQQQPGPVPDDEHGKADEARQREDDEELRRVLKERGLVPTRAFIKDPTTKKAKSQVADRVARFRDRQRQQGLVQGAIPSAIADAVKAAGGWQAWEASLRVAPPPPSGGETKPPAAPPMEPLSVQDRADLQLGRRVRTLSGWRRRVIGWVLG